MIEHTIWSSILCIFCTSLYVHTVCMNIYCTYCTVCMCVYVCTYVISPSWSLHRELILFVGYVRLSLRCSTRGDINNMWPNYPLAHLSIDNWLINSHIWGSRGGGGGTGICLPVGSLMLPPIRMNVLIHILVLGRLIDFSINISIFISDLIIVHSAMGLINHRK